MKKELSDVEIYFNNHDIVKNQLANELGVSPQFVGKVIKSNLTLNMIEKFINTSFFAFIEDCVEFVATATKRRVVYINEDNVKNMFDIITGETDCMYADDESIDKCYKGCVLVINGSERRFVFGVKKNHDDFIELE